jgi:hypothetical protein
MALREQDGMTGTHRSHGHPICKGARLHTLMAELAGKETGICRGRGGSIHLADNSVGIVGGIANQMRVMLSRDHRTIDGCMGAAFLAALRRKVERPEALLATAGA